VDVLLVKGVLEELDYILTDSVLGRETLGPGQKSSGIDGGLLDRETGRSAMHTEWVADDLGRRDGHVRCDLRLAWRPVRLT
jgi:hypothetical protein